MIRRLLGLAGAVALGAGPVVVPAHTSALGVSGSTVCQVLVTLNFSTAITAVPVSHSFNVSGHGSCTGLSNGTLSLSNSVLLTANEAGCASFLEITGPATLTIPAGSFTVNLSGAGPAVLQQWTLLDGSGQNALQATATLAWAAKDEIAACLSINGTSTMTLTGAMAIVT